MEPSPDDCNDDNGDDNGNNDDDCDDNGNDDDDCDDNGDDNGDDDCDDNGNDMKWTITLSILAFHTTYDARGDVDDKCSFALLYAISQSAPIVIVSWLLLLPL